jgi:hypothetical protein
VQCILHTQKNVPEFVIGVHEIFGVDCIPRLVVVHAVSRGFKKAELLLHTELDRRSLNASIHSLQEREMATKLQVARAVNGRSIERTK